LINKLIQQTNKDININIMGGLYNLIDEAMAQALGVDVKTYIEVIDKKCTVDEATFIIDSILEEDAANIEKAKALFTSKI
jgi:hypothetical protein